MTDPTNSAPTATDSTQRRPSLFTQIGDSAGLLLLAMAMGAGGGVGFGLARPTQTVTLAEGGMIEVLPGDGAAGFVGMLIMLAIAAGVGLIVGMLGLRQFATRQNLVSMLWVGVCALAGAFGVAVFGDFIGGIRQPDITDLPVGSVVEVVPKAGGVVNLAIAPFFAMFAFWLGILFSGPGDDGDDSDAE
ncbi:hypothetical protein KRX51_09715 [Corynebacterium sp. TAE3-ERU12]|uniref:hypothetical protein n=1 Tax=Corynebacterium sp. TAE3-ERU12 TaxID=2849491 RepID=UPI001C48EF46|nr:hypothetical protein [Corynebacterium sp. TAE3-ERU12]MBV7296186.1 hypothetical protein [Corynebacterium sp. TAE3-ERU12]